MNRTLRFTRVAPRQPTFSLLVRPHIARQQPLRTRWQAIEAVRRNSGLSAPSSSVRDEGLAELSKYPISTPSASASPRSDPTEPLTLDATSASVTKAFNLEEPKARFNEIKVQHISDQLHRQIFGNNTAQPVDEQLVDLAKKHLDIHDLLGKQLAPTKPIGFEMPKLVGESLDEHFFKLGSYTGDPWLGYAKKFAQSNIPLPPSQWNTKTSGWIKYGRNGDVIAVNCDPPQDEMLCFDVEVLYKVSPYAVLACAASPTAWYSWISPWVLGESTDNKQLISLGDPSKKRIVVGHNVSYDRARIAEEYSLKQTGTFFLDTMSLHAAVNGMCSRQRPTWMKHRKNKELREKLANGPDPELANMVEQAAQELEPEIWVDHSSINSLKDVAMFHCNIQVSKETRDMMGEMMKVEDLVPKLQECLAYCAYDVKVTHDVYKKVLPRFLETCPHPVSFSALRHMGSLLLPVNQSWSNYIANSEAIYNGLVTKVKNHLESLTEQAAALSFGLMSKGQRTVIGDHIKQLGEELVEASAVYSKLVAEENELLGKPKRRRASKASKTQADVDAEAGAETRLEVEPSLIDLPPVAGPSETKQRRRTTKKVKKQDDDDSKEKAEALERLGEKKLEATERIDSIAKEATALQKQLADDKILADRNIENIQQNPWSKENAWLSQLDWEGREVRFKKQKKPTDPLVPYAKQKLPGYPNWYKDLFKTSTDMSISVRTRVSALMLRLQWDGYPLVWTDKYGWTFRVPNSEVDKYSNTPMVQCNVLDLINEPNPHVATDNRAVYFKLPHNGGKDARCVNPLAKSYQRYFEDGVLTSEFPQAKEALDMNAACSYWISARERIKSQFVVWEDKEIGRDIGFESPEDSKISQSRLAAHAMNLAAEPGSEQSDQKELGLILPQIVTMGTITRRAIENTWLTASNAKKNRVGSELKAMIQAPPGYCFVGADVDSEELWIASLIGDAEFKMHGGNAIGFMTLEGSKAAATDMHSRTASVLGISRNNAKVFNYGRIYGAGLKFAASLLRQFNPNVNESQANEIAGNLYVVTKGIKTTRKLLSDKAFWRGGTESFVFNKLEEFAEQDFPKTPVLGAGITEALQKNHIGKGAFLTSRINWAIQSSGVDYLHLLIVSMDYLIQQYKLNARLMITVHDEIRYIVQLDDRYKVAMALQVANIWTRSMFSQQMGINDLPQSCAFFSAVDIDNVLRKEVDMDCITPSNPDQIPPGESVDIEGLIAKEEARLSPLEGTIDAEKLAAIEYTPRVPILEQLAQQTQSNIYQMKAQIAKDEKDLARVIKELKIEAPELMRDTTKGKGTVYDPYAWSDEGVDTWDLINLQGLPVKHSTKQKDYGWNIPAMSKPQSSPKKSKPSQKRAAKM
ncbi:DNA-directed DNA polymerase gamma mip1 [Orbilia oligospora]|uniref:DNA-directed DNA polymerase n=1 Tax=Orbilia oligospora TaxID=2813651 RepID=A0A7C8VFQ7_ORBOL|nr:DNA-directed DNA polymerase gamma mip1 [Orbilia oligospora]